MKTYCFCLIFHSQIVSLLSLPQICFHDSFMKISLPVFPIFVTDFLKLILHFFFLVSQFTFPVFQAFKTPFHCVGYLEMA